YEALSYVWGPPNFSESISCHGVACKVTPNLLAALRRLRYTNKDRTLWVDAICIRQSDIDERIQQVSRMGDIYSQASRVLVWLGDED
ncbi:heterokaryon incompatibility, partial [Thozetella sp. PMI_491]